MLPITQFPNLVEHYARFFEPLFTQASFIQFKRYISGLLVSENKTITGMNQLFINESRNQTSLNRWVKDSPFSLKGLNQSRLNMLESVPRTRIKPTKGVISLDDTLLLHYGQHFENIAKLWDHVSESYVWAHNMVSLHYSDEQTDYPISFELWEPTDVDKLETGLQQAGIKLQEGKFALKANDPNKWRQYLLGVWRRNQNNPDVIALYRSKFVIAKELLTQWVTEHPDQKLPVTFDPWYTKPFFCRYLNDTLNLPYVGTLNQKDEVVLQQGKKTLKHFADDLKTEHLKAQKANEEPVFEQITFKYKGQQKTYYSYCQTHHIAK